MAAPHRAILPLRTASTYAGGKGNGAMANGIEASADIVTGGLIGRSLEPGTGVVHAAHDHPAQCLNCGTTLIGSHCHACGQAGHVHRTAGAIIHDIAHGVFHFEGKIWRTLPMLIRRPGELTRRYVDGQRASFVSPLALSCSPFS